MAKVMSVVKSISRAAVVAVALGASTLVAVPAFAQAPGLSFGVQFGGGNGHRPGWDNNDQWGNGGNNTRCLSNREVRSQISRYGYANVDIVRELSRNRVDVTGQRGNWLYAMRVDKCTGEVSQPQRLRGVDRGNHGGGNYGGGSHNNGGGFGFEFNFGN